MLSIALLVIFSTCAISAEAVLSEEQIAIFERDGYVLVKGLLPNAVVQTLADAVAAAVAASPKQPSYFSNVVSGALFTADLAAPYRETAIYSQLPRAVAQLLKRNAEFDSIRVVRYVHFR
jgi:hypothetical protein